MVSKNVIYIEFVAIFNPGVTASSIRSREHLRAGGDVRGRDELDDGHRAGLVVGQRVPVARICF